MNFQQIKMRSVCIFPERHRRHMFRWINLIVFLPQLNKLTVEAKKSAFSRLVIIARNNIDTKKVNEMLMNFTCILKKIFSESCTQFSEKKLEVFPFFVLFFKTILDLSRFRILKFEFFLLSKRLLQFPCPNSVKNCTNHIQNSKLLRKISCSVFRCFWENKLLLAGTFIMSVQRWKKSDPYLEDYAIL